MASHLELVQGNQVLFLARVERLAAELVDTLLHEEPGLRQVKNGADCPCSLEIGRRVLNDTGNDDNAKEDKTQIALRAVICLRNTVSARAAASCTFIRKHEPDNSCCNVARHVAPGEQGTAK